MVSAAGASLPNADTVSFTEGVDVWRREEEKDEDEKEEEEPSTNRHTVQTAQIYLFIYFLIPILTFLSCPSGESDRKLAFTSSRSDPLELTEVTLRASPLSPPPPPPW